MRSLLSALARVALVASASLAAQSVAGQPVIEPARSGPCVEDAPTMRRQHMEYLKHQRDATVHGGVRGAKYSLKTCVACHASQQTNSVTAASTNFCVSCHSYAAVKIDCFECHANQPAP
jgi:predicted CXXCH cytochrome family protein